MTTPVPDPSVPQEIASRYGLGAVRFQSSMANLYEARDPDTGAEAVLKVLRTEAILSVPERQRVRRELAKLTTLRHDSLASVLAAVGAGGGASAGAGADSLWFVRLWATGENLRERIQRGGPVSPGEAAHIASRIAGALGELHRQGVLHRDLRAGHIILGPQDRVYLLDPGVGRMFKSPDGRPIVGAPGSVAPEAIAGKLVSFRSDLYGLGVVLYEMLTGAPPFDPADPEVLRQQAENDPPPLPDSVPGAFARLVTSLLSRDARERPFSAQQLERQLEPLVDLADPQRSLPPPAYFAPVASTPVPPAPNAVTLPSIVSTPPPVPAAARVSSPPPVPAIAKRVSEAATPVVSVAPVAPDVPTPIDAEFDIDDSVRTLMGVQSTVSSTTPPIQSPSLPVGITPVGAHDFESADEAPTKVSSVQELQSNLGLLSHGTLNGAAPPPNDVASSPIASTIAHEPAPPDAQLTRPRIPSIPPIPAGAPRTASVQPPSGQKSTLMGLAMVKPEALLDGVQPPAGSVLVPPRRQNLDYDDVSDTTVSEDSKLLPQPIDPAGGASDNVNSSPLGPLQGQRPSANQLGMAPTVQASYPQQVPAPNGAWQQPASNAWQQPQVQPLVQPYPAAQGYPQPSYQQAQAWAQAPNTPTQIIDEPPRSSRVPAALWIIAALALIMIPGVGGFVLARYISQRNAESDIPTLTVVPPSAPGTSAQEAVPSVAPELGALPVPPPVAPSPEAPPVAPSPEAPAVIAQQPANAPDHAPTNREPPRRAPHARDHDNHPVAPAHPPAQTPPAVANNPHPPINPPSNPPVVAANNHNPGNPPAVAPATTPSTGDLNEAIRRRDWAQASRILEGQVRAQPTSVLLHSQLGTMYERAGQPQRALSEYRTALRYDRRNTGVMHRLADTQVSTGDRAGAIETFRQILAVAPNDPAATARLAALQGGGH